MNFVDKLNSTIDTIRIDAAKEFTRRECRYKDILSIVIQYCENIDFINSQDVKNRTNKYEWLCLVVDINLIAIMLTDQIDGNDIPMNSEMIKEDNEAKAKQILESIVLKLVSASPKPDFRCL
ncbi:TPA: hypothetical protein NGT97_005316 [Vibrio parahaemolyticus]|uniref:hypothetical protein n=1 Tax=Vibrio parahaemolyticus TaxID=670 RepID=UPI002361FA02|nr:hypothetical protein [Vibrio parahaemolyticus]HCE2477628.1 hypothetical protein [Vibrio parahaemolyticus]HCE2479546.1 hypothetical protein [Vibrio parahaemolyticus]